jgi:hypothetical protein
MRKPVIAAVAIVAALALAVVVIAIATSGPSSAPGATAISPVPGPEGGALSGTAPGSLGPTGPGWTAAPKPPPPIEVLGPPRPVPPEGSWEAVPPVARPAALGKVGAAVGRALLELKPRLDACFDEDTQARFGPRPHTVVKDYAPIESRTTILMLQIEETGGQARIVDAPVESQGRASDGLIACAQQVLRGRTVDVPEARAGVRHRLLYALTQ